MAKVSEGLPFESPIPMTPSVQHTDDLAHSVISYLKRPQLLSTFRWSSTAARSENLFRPGNRADGLLVPTGLFSNRPMTARKLDGFTSFRATCVLKLQINSQPFQAGRLLMAAAPMPGLLGNRKQFIFSHVSNAQNLNHVQMDIAKDTEVELRIPFISPYNCFDLIDGKFDWAEVRILVYSPLNAVGGNCLQCIVYGHFEDIQLGAPTSGSVRQQSVMPSVSSIDNTKKVESRGGFTGALAQLGSSLINKGAQSLISALGWSKPILSKPFRTFLNRPTEGFQYMDGVDHSLVLGMTASNAVEPIPGLVGTHIDETSFDSLKRIPQMVGAFSFSDDILPCTQDNRDPVMLWQCAVSPSTNVPACYYVIPPEAGENVRNPYTFRWKQPTTLNYISAPFLYWTGSLVYTFKFIKTDYHSGRIEISYHPFVNTVDATRMDYVYKTVVDLRKNSEVSITVPYIAAQPWKRISTFLDPINPNPPDPGRLKDVITGMLYVRALTPLICANSIIASNIEVVVEMRGGDDFEVAGPITSKFMPFSFQNDNPVQQSGRGTFHQFEDKQKQEKPNNMKQKTKYDKIYSPVLLPYKNPKQQSADFRIPSSVGRIWTWWNGTDAGSRRAVMRGFSGYPLVHIHINGDLTVQGATGLPNTVLAWLITPKWEDVPPPITPYERGATVFATNRNPTYAYSQDIILENPNNLDVLYVFVTQVLPNPNTTPTVNPNMLHTIDITGYGRPLASNPLKVSIDSAQLPLPTTGGGGTGGTVTIDPSTLPLPVKVEQPEGPINVQIEEQPIEVKIDSTQLPLPTANQGGETVQTVRLEPAQVPLSVVTQNPVQVELLAEQFPLHVIQTQPVSVRTQEPVNVKIDSSQVPLPTTGGGGGAGGTVTINPQQLPLWTSEYNLAPMDPRNPTQQAGQIAMAGVTETRTRAMEGWIPPSITGNEQDCHRPSTVQWCIGEKFQSFRQYAKRFAFCLTNGLRATEMFNLQPVEIIRPGALYLRPTADSTGNNERTQICLYAPNSTSEVSGSPLSYVAGMYAFYRGSIRTKVWLDPRENPPNLVSGHLEYSRQTIDSNIINDTIENFMTPIAYETPNSKQLAEFQVPYYSPTIVSSTWSHGIDNQFDIPLANLVLSIPDIRPSSTEANVPTFPIKLAVAAGDDMDFHQFIGPPPVINLGDLTTNERILHYPPTGFTPTQKIALDTVANRRSELPASSFIRIPYSALRVQPNITGASCPPAPNMARLTFVNDTVSNPELKKSNPTVVAPILSKEEIDAQKAANRAERKRQREEFEKRQKQEQEALQKAYYNATSS